MAGALGAGGPGLRTLISGVPSTQLDEHVTSGGAPPHHRLSLPGAASAQALPGAAPPRQRSGSGTSAQAFLGGTSGQALGGRAHSMGRDKAHSAGGAAGPRESLRTDGGRRPSSVRTKPYTNPTP